MEMLIVIIGMFIFAFMCFGKGISNVNKTVDAEISGDWFKTMYAKEGLDDNRDNAIAVGASPFNTFLIYTNREYVYCVNRKTKQFEKVDKKDILSINVEVYHLERNVKRLIALTSTFDRSVVVNDVVLKMITRNQSYSIACMTNGRDGHNGIFRDRNQVVDDIMRIKLLLEDDIRILKETNV